MEITQQQHKNPWLVVSSEEVKMEGLIPKTVKPDQAVEEIQKNHPDGVLWFISGNDSLKHAFSFVQTIDKIDAKPSLIFITRGIQPIGPVTDLDSASFNGFYKTLKLEMPSLDCRHIDLGNDDSFPLKELLASDQEGQVAYRQGVRYVSRLMRVQDFKQLKDLKIEPEGSYLITGGFGALGLEVAKWFAKQGANHLVLVGRKPSQIDIPPVKIETVAVDISQRPAVDDLIQRFGKEWPELKGIIHAAGVLDDGVISSQRWSRFEKVFAPKVQGSWNLHEASLNKPLDFFVLFSSIASSLGSPLEPN